MLATCPAGYGSGGLGQHLARVREDALADGFEVQVCCHGGIEAPFRIGSDWEGRLFRFPPFRYRPELAVWLRHVVFDRRTASRIGGMGRLDEVTAFMGGALETFRAARGRGAKKLVLEMPNSHPENVREQHAKARALHPLEPSWMGGMFSRRACAEMLLADEIRVNSEYTARSLVERGCDPAKVVRRMLPPHPRFSSLRRIPAPDGTRTAVFVGSFTVFKGVALLVDAFRQVAGEDLRLVLVGGWSSRGMRRYLESARRADPRIGWRSGDPAPTLSVAEIAFHPSWEDGWGYAPAEAMAAGVPVVVSDQTGMKELVDGRNGQILAAGDPAAWTDAVRRWGEGR
jgi:glycosyltransferase involved in cell wall biosynthesis